MGVDDPFPAVHLLPTQDLTGQVAADIVSRYGGLLPNLASITLVLPGMHCVPDFAQALYRAAGVGNLVLPRLTTLLDLSQTIAVSGGMPDSARLSLIYGALRERNWFSSNDLWAISNELLSLFNELTSWNVHLPNSLNEFAQLLESAYNARSGDSLHFEARLVHELWYALAQESDKNPDSITAYQLNLARIAQKASGPLYVVGLRGMTLAEQMFLEEYARRQPVFTFEIDWKACAQNDSLADVLNSAWSELTNQPDATPVHLRDRGKALSEKWPQSPLSSRLSLFGARSLEQEASGVETKIRLWLQEGMQRIVVIVQDRLVARRARALLERAQVLVEDETGWTLSTTSASTVVMGWLDAVSSQFYYQDILDFLKSPFVFSDWPSAKRKHGVYELDQLIRKHSLISHIATYRKMAAPDSEELHAMLDKLEAAQKTLDPAPKALWRWLESLQASLDILGVNAGLEEDTAGRQLLQLLHRLAHELAGDHHRYQFGEFRRWLTQQMEVATFRDTTIRSPVVFTHLAASRLRNFDGAIMLGCDAAHFPGEIESGVFFNQSVRRELKLPSREQQLSWMEEDLLSLLASVPKVLVTWQVQRNGEENLISPYFERLQTLHHLAFGSDLNDKEFGLLADAASVLPPQPLIVNEHAANEHTLEASRVVLGSSIIPKSISASGYNSLMVCPYQYFGRHVLKLNELDEVQLELEKRDFGELVHDVLLRFHRRFVAVSSVPHDEAVSALIKISENVFADAMESHYLAKAWLLRWLSLVPVYLDWQRQRESEGWMWGEGEAYRELEIGLSQGNLTLKGRLDRVDKLASGEGVEYGVLDYKAQPKDRLKIKLSVPGEDVQLPIYAALWGDLVREAAYVSVDKDKVNSVVMESALDQLRDDVIARLQIIFDDLYQGAPMVAQGIDQACSVCEMRGVCRKDYWQT